MTLLISIDGLRPDAINLSDTPTIDSLISEGSYSLSAQTVMPSSTLPCHTSMLRGVDVSRHGITTNTFHPLVRPIPSIIDIACAAGLKVGFFYNWGPLRDLHDPESVDISYYRNAHTQALGDIAVSEALIEFSKKHVLDFCFLYLGYVDECGHANGWMSKPYFEAIANADHCLDAVMKNCKPNNVLLLSDHGGHERTHGTEMPEDMTIPWIVLGNNIKANHLIESDVRIFDTAPTLAKILGIQPSSHWDGTVIADVFTRKLEQNVVY